MPLRTNDSFYQIRIDEKLSKDDCDYDLLMKLADLLHVSAKNDGSSAAITVCVEGQEDLEVGEYCILQDGRGNDLGLFKNVDNNLEPVRFGLPKEIVLLRGDGISSLKIPEGWRLVEDDSIQSQYNVGTSPNWEVAAIEYVGL